MYCAPGNKTDGKTCLSLRALKTIARSINMRGGNIHINQSKYSLWEDVRRSLSNVCQHEWCWIDQDVVKSTNDPEILNYTFKPKKPHGKYQWLSTSNIHDVMKQYERVYADFVFFGPLPMDFNDIMPEVSKMNIPSLYKRGIRKIGVAFNTDPSSKPGRHWIGLFVDLNERTIEFFDSYAVCPPPEEIQKLIRHISSFSKELPSDTLNKKGGEFTVLCNNVRHQQANSECGVYVMNFITERLRGHSFNSIMKTIVHDEIMNSKRDDFFRPH